MATDITNVNQIKAATLITAGKMVKAGASGEPAEATNTDTDVASAVTLKHARQHAITTAADHTSTATPGQVLKADANGLPVNATNTDTDVASAVTLKHTRSHALDGTSDHTMGSLTTNYIMKAGATAPVNSQIFDNGTNVGVGKTPTVKLDVNGTIYSQDHNIYSNTTLVHSLGWNGSNSALYTMAEGGVTKIQLATATGVDTYFNGAGKFGIGKTNPTTKLDVNGTVTALAGVFSGDVENGYSVTISNTRNFSEDNGLSVSVKDTTTPDGTFIQNWVNDGNTRGIFSARGTFTAVKGAFGLSNVTEPPNNSALCVGNEGAFDLYSDNISHGVTTVLPTNVHGRIANTGASGGEYGGGLKLIGIGNNNESLSGHGIYLDGIGDGEFPLTINGSYISGTGKAAVPNDETLLGIQNNGTQKVTVYGSGDIVTTGGVEIASASAYYIGGKTEYGAWRFIKNSGNTDLLIQQNVCGTWTTRSTITHG
jgi:hypothetical protein